MSPRVHRAEPRRDRRLRAEPDRAPRRPTARRGRGRHRARRHRRRRSGCRRRRRVHHRFDPAVVGRPGLGRRRLDRHRELDGRGARREPALLRRVPGLRPDPRVRDPGGERDRERRRRRRARAPRAAQPAARSLPHEPDDPGGRERAVGCTAGVLGPAVDDRAALQRVPAALRRHARGHGQRRRRGARPTAPASRGRTGTTGRSPPTSTSTPACSPTRSACTTATSPSTASRRSSSPPPNGPAICRHPPVYVAGYAQGHPDRHRLPMHWPLDDIMDVGGGDVRAPLGALGVVGRRRRRAAALRRLLPVHLLLARGARVLPRGRGAPVRPGRRHPRRATVGSRSSPAAVHSATAGCTASRRCSSATCSSRSAPASASCPSANVGLACHSSPHWGGAVLYSREPL